MEPQRNPLFEVRRELSDIKTGDCFGKNPKPKDKIEPCTVWVKPKP